MKRTYGSAGILVLACFSLAGCVISPGSATDNSAFSWIPGGTTFPDASSSDNGGADPADSSTDSGGLDTSTLGVRFPDCESTPNVDWHAEILRLVNIERVNAGLDPVTFNQTLADQAAQYACEMIQYDFFAHENPVTGTDLADRAAEFAYRYSVIGENLAAGQSTPRAVMNDWMDSPDHRHNILEPRFTELGVGIRTGGRYGIYWVQEFGLPLGR